MMKICEILEIDNIKKGQVALNDKNIVFFLKKVNAKIVNTANDTVKYVVKRGNVFGLRIQKLERKLHDLLYKDSTTRIREFISDYLEEFGKTKYTGKRVAKNLL